MARIVDTLVTFASHESAKSVTDTENTEKSVQSILDKRTVSVESGSTVVMFVEWLCNLAKVHD